MIYLLQVKISRNMKGSKFIPLIPVPFDDIKFSKLFMKLYNKMFVMEEYKYLPPKYSYALKDLAVDLGVYEKADTRSIASANSSNISLEPPVPSGI